MGLPIPDLDNKTFDELVRKARSLIPRYAAEWTDHNLHDPGITFIELFAWLAETQIYRLNRVTDTHYQKFLQLVGLSPFAAQPARVNITFEDVPGEKTITAGTEIITEVGDERFIFETEEDYTLVPVTLEKILTIYDSKIIDNTQANEQDGVYFAPFGDEAPEGAELRLGFDDRLSPGKEIHLSFFLWDDDLPGTGSNKNDSLKVIPSVNLVWEYLGNGKWRALTLKKDTTAALARSGKIAFVAPPVMDEKDQLYWIRCRLEKGLYVNIPQINRILLNTISAVQIETIKNETLGTGRGIPEYVVLLNKAPVISGSQIIQVQGESGEWEDWEEVADFESSGPRDRHYLFDHQKGEITFGNGLNGRIPLESQKIRATVYQTTWGAKGNLPKEQQWRVNKEGLEGITGKNLQEAGGGKNAESLDEAKIRAKEDLRKQYRAITSEDFEQLAFSTPGIKVARAKALPNYHPDFPCIEIPGAMTVVVVPCMKTDTATPIPAEGFLQTVLRYLNDRRLIATDLHVGAPQFIEVIVKCRVRAKKKSSPTEVEKRVKKTLAKFLHPLNGGPEGKGWPFGRPVFPSEIYQEVDKVDGVDYVTGVTLSANGQAQEKDSPIKIPRIALVYSGEHQVEVI